MAALVRRALPCPSASSFVCFKYFLYSGVLCHLVDTGRVKGSKSVLSEVMDEKKDDVL